MRKDEIKNFTDEQLVANTINTFGKLCANIRSGMGIKVLTKNVQDLFEEMKKRGILSQQSIDWLNM